jgi:hypothetical protein
LKTIASLKNLHKTSSDEIEEFSEMLFEMFYLLHALLTCI